MSYKYLTRFQAKLNGESPTIHDKYLEYTSDNSSDSDSCTDELSSMEDASECSDDIFSYHSDSDEPSELESDDEEDLLEAKEQINKIVKSSIKKQNIKTIDDDQTGGKLDTNKVISLFLGDEDGENDTEENFLDTLSPEERKELLRLENQISKINHKRIPLRYQILRSHLPLEIKATAIKKLESIQKMDETSTEFHKMSTWIDGLLNIPFNNYVKEKLDHSVYGHVEAKSTLLEIVASWITNPTSTPTVIGLQGPPGTGKTTLIKDGVAKALGRPFSMFALGGATDASYLEGHSYTYEGSMWGRLASILMETKCMNPVIFMDELDKVSETKHGEEIIGVLTHLIDYSQNNTIQDKYFSGIPLDFSKALFIFSFNDEEKINPILKDRIHVIRTDKFTNESKLIIAKDYLIPSLLANVKFSKDDIIFRDETIREIIEKYTDGESGVRNLKRCLDSVIMKLNTLRLTSQNPSLVSSPNSQLIPYYLNDYKLPMIINSSIVDKLIGQTSLATHHRDRLKHQHMYS